MLHSYCPWFARVGLVLALGLAEIAHGLTPEQLNVLAQFKVLNSAGQEAPPPLGERLDGGWPYGVLVLFDGSKLKGMASLSHFGDGTVLTAAHNVEGDTDPRHYAVLYFDQQGNRRVSPIESMPVVEHSRSGPLHDFAVLKIPLAESQKWHAVNAKVARFDPQEFHSEPPVPRPVNIWVADPLFTRMPVARKFGMTHVSQESGAVIGLRTAIASRTEPKSVAQSLADRSTDPHPPVYLDTFGPQSDQTTRSGNSGALITSQDPYGRLEVVGVVSAGALGLPGVYRTNSGHRERERTEVAFSEGSVLENYLEKNLGFSHLTQDCRTLFNLLATKEL